MTGNDQPLGRANKSGAAVIRNIIVDAEAIFRPERRPTMTDNYESKPQQRRLGWLWVWAAFVIYFAFEVARLA